MQVNLSPSELQTIKHALSVAAGRFREDAKTMREPVMGARDTYAWDRLAEQFDKQERETLAVLTKMEEW